jgi:transposase InsO family protein
MFGQVVAGLLRTGKKCHDKMPTRGPDAPPSKIVQGATESPTKNLLYRHLLPDVGTVMALLPGWFDDYNEVHPHSNLRFLSPREFRRLSA